MIQVILNQLFYGKATQFQILLIYDTNKNIQFEMKVIYT